MSTVVRVVLVFIGVVGLLAGAALWSLSKTYETESPVVAAALIGVGGLLIVAGVFLSRGDNR